VVCDLSGPFGSLLAVLVAASLAGTALGLLISAVAPTTEAAIAFLPVVLLPFILLGGGIKPVHEMPATARVIAAMTPTRWAYEANLLQLVSPLGADSGSGPKTGLAEPRVDPSKGVAVLLRGFRRSTPRVSRRSVEVRPRCKRPRAVTSLDSRQSGATTEWNCW